MTDRQGRRYFPFLTPNEEERLLAAASTQTFEPEDLILDQDQSQRSIYLIEGGAVRVERSDRGAMIPLAVMGAGELFGEMSFVDGQTTSARIIADEPTTIRVVDAALVKRLSLETEGFEGRLYHSLAAILSQRLRLNHHRIYPDQSWG